MRLIFDRRFTTKLKGRIGKYDFDVGILDDAQYKKARRGKRGLGGTDVISKFAGGPVRRKSRQTDGTMLSEISKQNRDRLGVNYLSEPFKKKDSAIVRFSNEFLKLAFGKSQARRLENLLQAIVRNPILRGDYGSNSELTKKIKGFDRYMIDTAQLFKAIKAQVNVRGR